MKRKTLFWLAGLALVLILPLVYWLVSPLFIDQQVDEALPFELPGTAQIESMSSESVEMAINEIMTGLEQPGVMDDLSPEEKAEIDQTLQQLSEAMPVKEMAEESPDTAADWQLVSQGEFRDADNFHQGSGTAAIFQQGAERVLRFEDFEVTNGPDLHVFLVENVDATGQSDMGASIDLGALKGNIGNQNYQIPENVDLTRFSGVMIYCVPFHVVFATAPLPGS